MGIKMSYNDNLRKLPNRYGDISVMNHSFYTQVDDTFGLVPLWLAFFNLRRDFAFDVFSFSNISLLIEHSSALHRLQYIDGLPSLSLLVKAVFILFIKYRI